MLNSLLTTKFYIPSPRPQSVTRPRLTEKILNGFIQQGSFALISGPAGFGKTTLMSEVVRSTKTPVAWVSLDASDNDPVQFWTYVVTACQILQAEIGESVLSLLQPPKSPPNELIPSTLINEIAACAQDLLVILDDYHSIQNESIHAGIAFLLEHLPHNLHMIIATRVDPPWPLAKFRVRNQLVEIRAQDLRFSIREANSFLKRMMALNLSDEEVESLEERTEGWAAGLQLAALSMKGRADTAGFVNALKGSHVYIAGYLIEEVLSLQSVEVQDFLLQTSILDQMNGDLCEVVTGSKQGHAMLQSLQAMNLFVVSLDDEGTWYRYHNLFGDLLLAKLQSRSSKDQLLELHNRAAKWYEQAGMIPEAIEHALEAQDQGQVVQLIEKNALRLILQAHVRTVEAWLKSIPLEILDKNPKINMAFIWLNLLRGNIPQTAPYFERLSTIFSCMESKPIDLSLYGEWLALQSRLLSAQGNPQESRDLGNQAIEILPEDDLLVRSMVYINLATTYEQMFDYDHAAEIFERITSNAMSMDDFIFETLGRSGQARMELMQGHLHQAFRIASKGILRVESSGRKTPFSATFYGELSQIHYQWHQLDDFRKNSLLSIQASGKSGYSDPEIYHAIMLSKISAMAGDWEDAAAEIQKAVELAGRIPPAMIRQNLIAQQIRVSLEFERVKEASSLLNDEGLDIEKIISSPDLESVSTRAHPSNILCNSFLRILLFHGKTNTKQIYLHKGLEMASIVLDEEIHCNHIPIAIETLLIRSQLYKALGDTRNCLLDVTKALEIGEQERFISVFIEEGKPVADACWTLMERNQLETNLKEYLQVLLDAYPESIRTKDGTKLQSRSTFQTIKQDPNEMESLVLALTRRELEVLHLIAAGNSNQEIAIKLVITVSAVKKHISNIFDKLSVKSRTQAIVRARQCKILPNEDNS